jgi:NTE family protein
VTAAPAHPDPRPGRTAVVLGSSFLGVYAHAGFLNGLDAAGLRPARVAGASAGALAGALFCSGLRGESLREAALDRALRHSFLDWGGLLRLPGVLTSLWSSGLFSGRRTVAFLRRRLGPLDLADLGLPLDIAVTDVATSRREIRRDGPLAELVMASCAVPALFTIQEVGGRRYLDGGIADELPFEHLVDDDSVDTILIHVIRHEAGSGPNVRWETVANAVGIAHHTACNELHRLRTDLARSRGKRLIEIETSTPFPGLLGQRRASICYQRGLDSARSALAAVQDAPEGLADSSRHPQPT